MSMNNGPASVPSLVGAVPKRTQWKEEENPVWGFAVRVQSAPGVTCNTGLRCELWEHRCQRVSSNNYCAKVTQADSNNEDSGDRCIKKVKSRPSVFWEKGRKISE